MDAGLMMNDLFSKLKRILVTPEEFFQSWDQSESFEPVLMFNVIGGLLTGVLYGILYLIFTFGLSLLAIILNPIFLLISMFVSGLIYFVCFKMMGGVASMETTIKMVGYSQAVQILSLAVASIPFIGIFISPIIVLWQIWVLVVAGKIIHQLDTGKSLIAVLIPVVVCCVIPLIIMFATMGVGILSAIMSGGAQGY